jgi:beta-lactamase regulating signal transducer with metallopeptidase domain
MNGSIEQFNALADDWIGHLWRGAWQGGVALAVVWLLCRLWPKLPPRVRYGLWCGAFLKLLVAATPVAPINLPLLRSESDAAAPASVRASERSFIRPNEDGSIGPVAIPAPRPTSAAIIFGLWIVGSVFMTVRLVRDRFAAGRLRRQARPVDDRSIIDVFTELCRSFGVHRGVPLLAADDIDSPLLAGMTRPVIVLPSDVMATALPGRLRLMLAHELAHLRHGDLLLNLLPAVSRVVFFFHPMVWLAERQWRLAQESACDRAAIAATGCGVGEYGEMLLGVAAWPRPRRMRASSAVITAFESRKTLERRLLAMKYFSLWSRRTSRSMVVVLTLVVLTALVPWRVVAQQRAATAGNAGAADPAAPPAPKGTKPATAGESVSVLGVLTSATAEVKCPVDTVIREVQIKEGARVKKGDLLFQLDSRRARDAMVEAEAQLKAAEIKYKRQNSSGVGGDQRIRNRRSGGRARDREKRARIAAARHGGHADSRALRRDRRAAFGPPGPGRLAKHRPLRTAGSRSAGFGDVGSGELLSAPEGRQSDRRDDQFVLRAALRG